MATHDYVIANGTGAAVRSDLNGALAAIVSNNSSATEPGTMYAYQWWPDTTTGLLKQRNAANNAWITIGTLASTNLGLLSLAGGTMTGVLAVTAGTAALPGIAVSGDLNTGIHSPGADELAISTGGTVKATIDSSGRLLVGTSTHQGNSILQVQGEAGAATAAGVLYLRRGLNTAAIGANVGADLGKIQWGANDGTIGAWIQCLSDATWSSTSDTPSALVFSTTADGGSSPTERMRITSTGQILIGTTSTTGLGGGSSVNQGVQIGVGIISSQRNDTANNFWAKATGYTSGDFTAHYVNNTYVGGISTNGSTTTYATASDYRLKENIVPVTGSIVRFQQLKPRRFNFIGHSQSTVDGFLAHEVQQIVPEAVVGEKDATNEDGTIKPQGIDQSKLVPLLTAALQEAIAKIESLEARLTAAGIA